MISRSSSSSPLRRRRPRPRPRTSAGPGPFKTGGGAGGPASSPRGVVTGSRGHSSDGEDDEDHSRSCLAFRLPKILQQHQQSQHQPLESPVKHSQSQQAQQAQEQKQKQHPLVMQESLQLRKSDLWESFQEEEDSRAGESSSRSSAGSSPFPVKALVRTTTPATTPTTTTTADSPPASSMMTALLTPPAPSNRSIKHRLQLEHEKRRKGLYEGEMEPAGFRGQEATPSPPAHPQTPSPLMGGVLPVFKTPTTPSPGISPNNNSKNNINNINRNINRDSLAGCTPLLRTFTHSSTSPAASTPTTKTPSPASSCSYAGSLHLVSPMTVATTTTTTTKSSATTPSISPQQQQEPYLTLLNNNDDQDQPSDCSSSSSNSLENMRRDLLDVNGSGNGGDVDGLDDGGNNYARPLQLNPRPLVMMQHQQHAQQQQPAILQFSPEKGAGHVVMQQSRSYPRQPDQQDHQQQSRQVQSQQQQQQQQQQQLQAQRQAQQLQHEQDKGFLVMPPQHTPPRRSVRATTPTLSKPSDESTQSDQDIRNMLPDLMPSSSESRDVVRNNNRKERSILPLTPPRYHDDPQDVHSRQPHPSSSSRQQPDFSPSPISVADTVTATNVAQQKPIAVVTPSPNSPSRSRNASATAAVLTPPRQVLEEDQQQQQPDAVHLPDNVHVLHRLAMDHIHNGEYDNALLTFSRVLQKQRQLHGDVHPSVASAFHNLGTVHAKRAACLMEGGAQQRHVRAQALACFQAAARAARDSLGRNHPNVAVSLVRIGFLLLQSRQYQNAIVTFQEALRIRLACFGGQHGLVANLYNNLGVCNMHLAKFQEGRAYLEAALDIQRDVVHATVVKMDKTMDTSSTLVHLKEKKTKNKDVWMHKLELADTLFNIGGLCLEWMRRQGPDARRAVDAEEAFAEALEIRTQVLGPDDPMVLQVAALLDMARAVPRPFTPNRQKLSRSVHSHVHSDYEQSQSPHQHRSRGANSSSPPRSTLRVAYPEPPEAALFRASSSSQPYDERQRLFRASPGQPDNERLDRNSIFRQAPPASVPVGASSSSPPRPSYAGKIRLASKPPPVAEVVSTLSMEYPHDDTAVGYGEASDGGNKKAETRIYVSPHLVPSSTSADGVDIHNDSSQDVIVNRSAETSFMPDVSADIVQKAYSYDAEENCLLSETGVDSDHGKIHYPLSWNKAGLDLESSGGAGSPSRDIMVARPFRTNRSRSSIVPSASTNSSDKWGSETVNFSTGNKERDDVMNRARLILQAHDLQELLARRPPQGDLGIDHSGSIEDDENNNDVGDEREVLNRRESAKRTLAEQDVAEDGVAALGGDWPRHNRVSHHEMIRDPMNHLHQIHDEASKKLLANDLVDALALFETVLQCQRRRHGHLHPDVAAALHNVGIVHLRSQNHAEALRAFEEAARIRKGSLGRDHPHVAESLVKVGITLLLLHRFDDALWSFREALSVRKHAMGSLHPSTARIYNNLGCVHVEINEFREARRAFEAALDIQRNSLAHDPDSGPLMFGTATTLCNLGYLYRYRDLHGKATLVLKEALDLQERVLGRSHATVLSTLDNLADSCANSGHAVDALKYYNMVLERFRVLGAPLNKKGIRAEAVLLYKMSRVHRQRNDREAQLDTLKLALRAIRSCASRIRGTAAPRTDTLERRIIYDIRSCREQLEKDELKWI